MMALGEGVAGLEVPVTSAQRVEIALTLLTPVVTAALGIVSLMVGDWRQRKSEAGRRKLVFDDATRQVSFVADWWNARKPLTDSHEAQQEATTRASAWLEEAYALVADSKPPVQEKPGITVRRLLLLYPLQSRAARVIRVAFYVLLSLVVWTVSFVLDDILMPGGTPGIAGWGREFIEEDLGILAVWMVLAIVLHHWVQHVDKPKPKSHRPVTIRRVMLFYPFHRPAARIVRILFYLWIPMMVVEAVGKILDDPKSIPGVAIRVVAYIGYGAALRYWAVWLERRTSSEVSGVASSTGTVDEPRAGVAPAGSA